MKIYEKRYEDYIRSDRRKNKFKVEHFDIAGEGIESMEQYINTIREESVKMQKEIFNRLVKLVWLFRKFTYYGYRRLKHTQNNSIIDLPFSVFITNIVGMEVSYVTGTVYGRIIGYFDNFFPNFDLGNPFIENYEYPYEYVKFEHLSLVCKLPDRMEFLKIAEENKMSYPDFFDYVVNWIMCYNEEVGYEHYIIGDTHEVPKITINKKYEKSKQERKRETSARRKAEYRANAGEISGKRREYYQRRKVKTGNIF